MIAQNRTRLSNYLFAVVVTGLALLISYAVLLRQTPFLPCIAAVALVSWRGGRGPGLLAALIAVASTSTMIFLYQSTFAAPSNDFWRDVIRELLFISASMIIIAITDALQKSEFRAREQSEWLGATLNNVSNGVISVDPRGKVEYLNPLARYLTGWGDEAIGLPLEQVFKTVSATDGEPLKSPLLRGKDKNSAEEKAFTEILIAKDGTRHTIEDSSSNSTIAGSKYRSTVLVFRDVTGQRKMETELRRAADRHRLALDAGRLVSWEWNLRTNEVDSQDLHKLFTPVKGPAVSDSYFNYIIPEDLAVLRGMIEKSIETHEPYSCKFRCVFPGNELAWMESFGKPTYDDKNQPVSIIGVSRNITEERLVEEIVREGQEQFRNLAESAKDGFVSIDDRGKILYANASCAAIFGYSRSELIGQYLISLIPERLRQRHMEGFGNYTKTGVKTLNWSSVEFFGLRKDGSEVPLELSYSETRSGHKHLFTAVIRDITERKQAQQLLAWEKSALEPIVSAVPLNEVLDGLMLGLEKQLPNALCSVLLLGEDGKRLWHASAPSLPAEYNMAVDGVTIGPTVGSCGTAVYLNRQIIVSDIDTDPLWANYPGLARKFGLRACWSTPIHGSQKRILGTFAIYYRTPREPVSSELDLIARAVHITRIAIERKQAEEIIRASRERLALAQRAAGIGTYDRNLKTGIVRWTSEMEALFGLKPGTFDGRAETWIQLIHPEDRDKTRESAKASLEERGDFYVEYRVIWPDGSVHWLGNRGKIMLDARGEPETSLGACLDVSQRRALEGEREHIFEREKAAREQAERSSRLKDEFIATVSHELRTPLTAILGWSKMLLQGGLDDDTVRRGLESIDRNAAAQASLVEDLLDLSRITAGRMRLHLKPMNLSTAVSGAVDGVRPAAQAKRINFQLALAPVQVNGDIDRLHQVAYNILFNSVKFSERGGGIEVTVEAVKDVARLIVRDHGIGIAPEFLPQLFRLFSQGDSSSTRRFGGMGLGLAIVRNLVELHGGTVRAESEGEGKGATMIVELPLCRPGDTVFFKRQKDDGSE